MPKIVIPFTCADIIQTCHNHDIDPDPVTQQIEGWAVTNWYIRFYDNAAGGFSPAERFVWFSPDLTVKIIKGPMALLRDKRVPCGFDLFAAILYKEVYVVGPVAAADLQRLQAAGVVIDAAVPYDSPAEVRDYLEAHL